MRWHGSRRASIRCGYVNDKDTFEEAWRELEEVWAQYDLVLTPEQQQLLESAYAANHPILALLTSCLDSEAFTFYDTNQSRQNDMKKVLRKLEEEQRNSSRQRPDTDC